MIFCICPLHSIPSLSKQATRNTDYKRTGVQPGATNYKLNTLYLGSFDHSHSNSSIPLQFRGYIRHRTRVTGKKRLTFSSVSNYYNCISNLMARNQDKKKLLKCANLQSLAFLAFTTTGKCKTAHFSRDGNFHENLLWKIQHRSILGGKSWRQNQGGGLVHRATF